MTSVTPNAQDLVDFVDTASIGLHWLSADGTILWANPADYERLGYEEAEYVGRSIAAFHADRDVIGDILRRLLAGERLHNYEALLRCKDGSTRKVLITSSARYDGDGRFLHTRCFTVDVSRQRPDALEVQVEALTREVERLQVIASRERGLIEAILAYSPHGIIVSDPSGKLVLQNEAAEKIWAGSATADDVASWGKYRAFHPDGRAFDGADWAMARALSQRIVTEGEEFHIQRFDDTRGVLLGSSAPLFGVQGELTGAVAVFADITKLKRQEEELRREMAETLLDEQRRTLVVEAGALLASGLDYESTLSTVANLSVPALADWCAVDILSETGTLERLAIAHVDPAKVQSVRRIEAEYPPNPRSRHGVHEVLRSGKAQLLADIPDAFLAELAVDGEHLRLLRELGLRSAMVVPLRGSAGILGALTFVSAESGRRFDHKDVTTAEQLANVAALAIQNARSYRDAIRANHAKDEFLATVSHELRTPLSTILGWARMLRGGTIQGEKLERALEIIERNSLTQVRLIEELLDVSRVISGKMRLDVQSVELAPVVDAALESVEHALQAKDITLLRVVDPQAGPIRGDGQRLQQVLWNLLSNAVKFTPKGGKIRLLVERVDSSIELTVHDTGQGIPAHLLSSVFERFKQADGSRVRVHGGLGLGLAIARHIVELHGGTIEAHSEGEGRGATFVVRLPVAALRPSTGGPFRHPSSAELKPRLEHPPDLQGLSVLIVDDEADTREMLAELLAQRGCSVITAASASEALGVLDRASPQVIVCDIGMPGTDGYGFIEQVRQRPVDKGGRTVAVALTAYAAPEDRRKALRSGFQMHVAKPVEPAELLVVVANLAQLALTASRES